MVREAQLASSHWRIGEVPKRGTLISAPSSQMNKTSARQLAPAK